MKRPWMLLGLAALLASCAPSVTGPRVGRIVNSSTGEVGTFSFTRDTLRPRIDDPNAAVNATIEIGGQVFTGSTVVVNSGMIYRSPDWSVSFGYGNLHHDSLFGWGADWNPWPWATVTRTGNLVARSSGEPPRILTCNFTVDDREHGIGECLDQQGLKYTLQF